MEKKLGFAAIAIHLVVILPSCLGEVMGNRAKDMQSENANTERCAQLQNSVFMAKWKPDMFRAVRKTGIVFLAY